MKCKCREECDEKLKTMNLRLVGYTYRMPSFEVFPQVKTEWIDAKAAPKGKAKSPPPVMATHCPFCGTPVESENAEASQPETKHTSKEDQ